MVSVESMLIILFFVIAAISVYKFRSKLTIMKLPGLFPLFYIAMYKSRLGIGMMDRVSSKLPRLLRVLGYIGIFIGFIGMGFILYSVVQGFANLFLSPEAAPSVAPVLPIKAKGVFFIPFFYWIISIFVLAVVHEFSHGVIARLYRMPLKSTGFAFISIIFPIIPFAFVEPNEAAMARRSIRQQLSVLAAGSVSNIALGLVLFALLVLLSPIIANSLLNFDGVQVSGFVNDSSPLKIAGMSEGEIITEFNSVPVSNYLNFSDALGKTRPGQSVKVKTNVSEYRVIMAQHTDNPERGYLGVYAVPHFETKESARKLLGGALVPIVLWLLGLLAALYTLNLGVGLFNLAPVGPLDGGRMLRIVAVKGLGKKNGERLWKGISIIMFLIVALLLLFAFVR